MPNLKAFIKKNAVVFIVLFILVFISYVNSLNNAFVSDDISSIPENPKIGDITTFLSQPYAFIQPLLYSMAFKVGGLNPFVYRLINILFHLGTVWVIYGLFYSFTRPTIAFFSAALFAVHPILIESVTWISGGPYVRYSFFLLASLLTYKVSEKNKTWYYASVLLYALSLFSSEKAIVFPLILFVYEIAFSNIRKNWKRLIPFFVLSSFWAWTYFLKTGQRTSGLQTEFYQEPTVYNPLIQIPIAITSYLQLIVWPDKLTIYHSEMRFTQIQYFMRLVIFLIFVAYTAYSFIRSRPIFFWLSFFIISLGVTLLPFGWSWIVAERYVYLGTVGIVFVAGYGLAKLTSVKKTETLAYVLFSFILLSLIVRTVIRNSDWKDEDALWIATAKTSPSYHVTHNNLGYVYAKRGDLVNAVEEYKLAIRIKPNYGDAYHNLGNVYLSTKNFSEALKSYQQALKYNPNLWQSYQNIATIFFEHKDFTKAEENLLKAIKINPQNSHLYTNLGAVYLNLNSKKKAENAFQEALKIDPQDAKARLGLVEIQKISD